MASIFNPINVTTLQSSWNAQPCQDGNGPAFWQPGQIQCSHNLTNVLSMYFYCSFTFEPGPLKIQLSVGLTSYELLIRLAASGMYNAVSGIQTRVILLATTPVSSLM